MGQKVNPIGLRLGVNRTWDSRWFATNKDYAKYLQVDLEIRRYIKKNLGHAGVARVIVERPAGKASVTIYAARPGVIIGKKGGDIDKIRSALKAIEGDEVALNVVEARKPELDAVLVAQGIASQLEKRVSFRKAMKRAVQTAMRFGAQGIRINCSGRLGGAEIARMEWYREGRVPLHMLRANVDYAHEEALTTYGILGIKVWIFRGEIMEHDPMAQDRIRREQ